ncbi:hypothetical protein BKA82DRAFT_152800 [Pisolithus tinctorius]|uniref:Uncharacterized protein n=1 Tax=Pisolithus tinctorius Marx 270 TaxID=870435 RepID=A0A0C3NYR3_PISTI|nr:hypothetical protein BKA82DRAFT_152800 [Pisolithus tinctorius]KIO00416.1 hypothetical protein M404DRAFT_152800 [Pisolithus tinctorius Marx 270]
MELTDCIASYMKARFQEEVFSGPRALPDISIPFPVLCEADRISSVISQAYRRPSTSIIMVQWKISYSTDLMEWQADIWNHLHLLREPLWESIKASPQAWWMDMSYFCDNAELKGAINLSPAWFQQGCGVGDHCLPCK